MTKELVPTNVTTPGKGHFLVYEAEDGQVKIDVRLEDETVWLTQQLMANLFQTTKQNVGQHLKNAFSEDELFENSKEEELGHKSVPRNPLLFGLFYRMNLVEQIGSGVQRIRDLCRDYGVAEPRFEVSENWLTVSFPRMTEEQVGTKTEPSGHYVGTKSAPS
jgi:hypothetical protein